MSRILINPALIADLNVNFIVMAIFIGICVPVSAAAYLCRVRPLYANNNVREVKYHLRTEGGVPSPTPLIRHLRCIKRLSVGSIFTSKRFPTERRWGGEGNISRVISRHRVRLFLIFTKSNETAAVLNLISSSTIVYGAVCNVRWRRHRFLFLFFLFFLINYYRRDFSNIRVPIYFGAWTAKILLHFRAW